MHTQTKRKTVTFARAFLLDGLDKVLPAGAYSVESENDVLDGMFLPDCLRTSVLIHLHKMPGSSGYSQTLTVSWEALEAALSRDQSPAVVAPPQASLEEMLLDPIIRQIMYSDGVSEAQIRDLASHMSLRNLSDVASER
jgi:hypothetical protein